MARTLKLTVGRERNTRAVKFPSEAGYIQSIREQMKAIEKNMLEVVKHVGAVTPEAIEFGLKPIFEESQRLVPVDTGKLKRSGFIETRQTASGTQAVIGYGRYGSPGYTAVVHENLSFRHRDPTQAKFLETAVKTKLGDFRRRIEMFYKKTMPGLEG